MTSGYRMTKRLAFSNSEKWNKEQPDIEHVPVAEGMYWYIEQYDRSTGKYIDIVR